MDGRADSLVMTVHLLAKSGYALLLQQTLSQLQEWICLDVCLFLVSEVTSPVKYYETNRQKSSRFPGTSVLLFLHEDSGGKRIFQVHDFFQHPPWHRVNLESANGKLSWQALGNQEFYGLDEHMPVWGVRQVHYGTEILRITLYCSFDNYDDAVRLYEMILQKEATVQKSTFCAFILYTTESIAVQLCLKQLPLGLSVDLKESSVLQFKVHEIGQLVPLLPNPCFPISRTRWQTEDYEGNKILLQVQNSSKHSGKQDSLPSWLNNASEEGLPHYSSPSPLAMRRIAVQQKNRTLRAVKNKNKSTRSGVYAPGSLYCLSQSHYSSSSQSCCPKDSSLQDLMCSYKNLNTQLRLPSCELQHCREEEETNVDTGNRVEPSESDGSPLSRFSRDLRDGLPPPQDLCCSCSGSGSTISLLSVDRNHPLLQSTKIKNKGLGEMHSGSHLRLSRTSYGNEKEEDEEFFI
ncbi:protein FAM124B [Heteronotia binoei]|uniref:protein FAM124B n=1 Tax=Heteronotia binoei TaxID=13085 RepID=UPI00292DCC17|nr:protein FAM124B [Heteronotia binoei]XP_060098183.1 protein FAM124B [Heteronotia binoei]XP_060098184.1 protein FAM124B [Heteronotia binoei]